MTSPADRSFCSLLAVLLFAAVAASDPIRLMPIGDSITAGYTDNPIWNVGFNHGYRSGLYTQLTNAGHDILFVGESEEPYNDAFPGDPSRGGTYTPPVDLAALGQDGHRGYGGVAAPFFLANLADTRGGPGWLTIDDPDVVLIHLGTNGRLPVELDRIVMGIITSRPDTRIVLAQIVPKAFFEPGLIGYNQLIETTLLPKYQALGAKIVLADHYTAFLTDPNDPESINLSLMATGNHPNGAGYDVMADVWFDAVERVLALTDPGDFNGDGGVDAADYAAWSSAYGATGDQPTDANGDGLVNAADYTVWRDASDAAGQPIPEPGGAMLLAGVVLGVGARRRG